MAMMAMPTYPIGQEVLSVKVTKVGFLQRKDDVLEGGKKAGNRKWKEWGVMLTGSQLLFSRDPNWTSVIQSQLTPEARSVPRNSIPRPDEMLSVRDAVAVYDRSYTKVCFLNNSRWRRFIYLRSTGTPCDLLCMMAVISFCRPKTKWR